MRLGQSSSELQTFFCLPVSISTERELQEHAMLAFLLECLGLNSGPGASKVLRLVEQELYHLSYPHTPGNLGTLDLFNIWLCYSIRASPPNLAISLEKKKKEHLLLCH